jgi:bacterioferritin
MRRRAFLSDVKALRDRARGHMREGAVTAGYGADRATVLKLLNEALATEIVCILRYKRHQFMAKGIHARDVAAEFAEHAAEEAEHADLLAQRIVQLGGEPDYSPATLALRSHTEYAQGGGLTGMIEENLAAERVAIESYGEIVRYIGTGDPTTRRLFEGILAQEEEHAEELASLLQDAGGAARGERRRHSMRARSSPIEKGLAT